MASVRSTQWPWQGLVALISGALVAVVCSQWLARRLRRDAPASTAAPLTTVAAPVSPPAPAPVPRSASVASPAASKTSLQASAAASSSPSTPSTPPAPLLADFTHEGFSIQSDHITIHATYKARLLRQRQEALRLAAGAGIVPNLVNGRLRGFRLVAVRPGTLLYQVGLRDGDTVVALNGEELTDMARMIQLLGPLQQATNGTVVVQRGSKRRTIHVDVR